MDVLIFIAKIFVLGCCWDGFSDALETRRSFGMVDTFSGKEIGPLQFSLDGFNKAYNYAFWE